MRRVLLIDDAEDCRTVVALSLGESFELLWAPSLAEGRSILEQQQVDLLLLDVILPDGDGFRFCARLQNDDAFRHIPVILLTGQSTIDDKVMGFSVGADDYIVKPFHPAELRARIEGKIQKRQALKNQDDVLLVGEIRIDLAKHVVSVGTASSLHEPMLTPIEFRLLVQLAQNPDRILSRDQLMTSVWGANIVVLDRTIDKHISALRQKLGPASDLIQTCPGFGYMLSLTGTVKKAS